MVIIPSKWAPLAKGRQEDWDEAREAYLLAHAPGLKEHYAVQQRAFSRIKEDAQNRHPDPTPEDIAAALAAEAALPYRKRTEAQLRRDFEPLAAHLSPGHQEQAQAVRPTGAAGMEQSQSQTPDG